MGDMHRATAFLMFLAGLSAIILAPGCARIAEHCPLQTALFTPAPPPKAETPVAAPAPAPVAEAQPTAEAPKLPEPDVPCLWPVKEDRHCILSGYGPRGRRRGGPGQFHRAVDIKATMNAPVVAAASGRVKQAMRQGSYGKILVVDHGNGYESAYAHLNEMLAEAGQVVERGEVIARAGQTGNATTPHIHYEIRHDGQAVNPTPFLPEEGVEIAKVPSTPPKSVTAASAVKQGPAAKKPAAKSATPAKSTAKAPATSSGKASAAKKTAKTAPAKAATKKAPEKVASKSPDKTAVKKASVKSSGKSAATSKAAGKKPSTAASSTKKTAATSAASKKPVAATKSSVKSPAKASAGKKPAAKSTPKASGKVSRKNTSAK